MLKNKIYKDQNRYVNRPSLYNKVRQYTISNGELYNYIGIPPLCGKFKIAKEDIKSLMVESIRTKQYLSLVESYDETSGQILMWDLDIPLKKNEENIKINIDTFLPFINIINDILKQNLKDLKDEDLTCYVLARRKLEKNVELKQEQYHYGIHIYYPEIILNLNSAKLIYDLVILNCQKKMVFQPWYFLRDDHQHISKYSNIVDKITGAKTGIVIHGGAKKDKLPYAIQYKVYADLTCFMYDGKIETEYEYFLDKFSYNQPFKDIYKVIEREKTTLEKKSTKTNSIDSITDFVHVREIMELINPERANDRDSWFKIGLCLHQISTSDEMKEIFIEFSKKCPEKFDLLAVTKTWNSLPYKETGGMTIGTLKHFAKTDNPEKYEFLIDNYLSSTLNETIFDLKNTNFDIASLMYKIFKGQFICANIEQNIWYKYENHKWNKEPAAHNLYLNISTKLENYFSKKLKSLQETNEIDEITEKCVNKIIHDIKSTSFKKNVVPRNDRSKS